MADIFQFLNGEVPGGFAVWIVTTVAFLFIWEYVYRLGDTLLHKVYRRWRFLAPLVFLLIYALFWLQAPPKVPPIRIAVVAADGTDDAGWTNTACANLTVRRIKRTLPNAVVNPWEEFMDASCPTSDALTRAGYRVFEIHSTYDSVTTGITCRMDIKSRRGKEPVQITAELLQVSAALAESILNKCDKHRSPEDPFQQVPQLRTLIPYYQGLYVLRSFRSDSLEVKKAYTYAVQALEYDSEFLPAQWLLARCLELEGEFDKAHAVLLNSVQSSSSSTEALLSLGRFSLRRLEWDGAEAALKIVWAREPRNVAALDGLARLHPERLLDLRMKSPEALLKEALRLDPTCERARIALADLLEEKGDPGGARRWIRHGLEIQPDSFDLLLKLGALELKKGNLTEARQTYEKILEKDPRNVFAIYNLGVLDYRERDYDRALERFREIQGMKAPVNCYYYMGLIYQSKGDSARAKLFLKKRWEERRGDDDAFGQKAREYFLSLGGSLEQLN